MMMKPNPIRKWRKANRLSLEEACDLFAARGLIPRPSIAKLSRIEREQAIPVEMIPAIIKTTGIPARMIRPDLAKLFGT
jgi:transcriptional regulator with XRE-family HTH domain